jgi:hypothetical protein
MNQHGSRPKEKDEVIAQINLPERMRNIGLTDPWRMAGTEKVSDLKQM